MAGTHQAIATIVAWTARYEHFGVRRGWILLLDGVGTAEPRQLHELVYAELVGREQFLVNGRRFFLVKVAERRWPSGVIGTRRH